MWLSASKRESNHPEYFVIIGSPASRRVELFQSSLTLLKLPPAQVVSYLDLLSGKTVLPAVVRRGAAVRIESPGKDFEIERALLALGADASGAAGDAGDKGYERLSRQAADRLTFDRGRILYPRQWYLGYCEMLHQITRQLAECPFHHLMNSPPEIALMFDKNRCHEFLSLKGLPVPPGLGAVRSFDELTERMRQESCRRVFIKLAHGSSASGVVAYHTDGRRHEATTTVEMVRRGGELRLYNSRRIRVYRRPAEIRELIDALSRHGVHVEQWIPKAGFEDHTFDLRVVVIGGRAQHVAVRMSRNPMTNLHLLNKRGDPAAVRVKMGEEIWNEAMLNCERAMLHFPASLYAGVDLLITPGFRRQAVAEINAFGDLLPGILWEGRETYTTEILALREKGLGRCLMQGA